MAAIVLEARDINMAAENIRREQAQLDDIEKVDEEMELAPLSAQQLSGGKCELRSVNIPPHRMTPLKTHWMEIYSPIVEHLNLQIRINVKRKVVQLRTSSVTNDSGAIQKAADFVRAFMLGFEIRDAIAILRLDDLYIDSFEIKDVKTLQGEHMSRAIGRVAGQGGKTKFTIENATKTRIVLADSFIHILGSFSNIKVAKSAIVRLLRGSPPGKVYSQMRAVASRMKDRY